jgi:adenylyl cyclase-associated protein
MDLENANSGLTSLSNFLLVMQKPASMANAQDFFKPLNDAIGKAAAMTEGRRPDYFNHMKSVADSLAALAWVAFLGKDCG